MRVRFPSPAFLLPRKNGLSFWRASHKEVSEYEGKTGVAKVTPVFFVLSIPHYFERDADLTYSGTRTCFLLLIFFGLCVKILCISSFSVAASSSCIFMYLSVGSQKLAYIGDLSGFSFKLKYHYMKLHIVILFLFGEQEQKRDHKREYLCRHIRKPDAIQIEDQRQDEDRRNFEDKGTKERDRC